MCDKSLPRSPCEVRESCGISVCFRTLFRSHRQVAHALLTRPPLTSRSKLRVVRSTWMCYARRQRSSWARIKLSNVCIYILRRGYTSELIPLYCFKSIFWNSLEFFRASSLPYSGSLLCLLLFNFQGACRLSRAALLLYHILSPLSTPFFNLFYLFSDLLLFAIMLQYIICTISKRR